jgi:hypothetical protein
MRRGGTSYPSPASARSCLPPRQRPPSDSWYCRKWEDHYGDTPVSISFRSGSAATRSDTLIVPQLQDYVFLTSLAHALQNETQGRKSSFAPETTEIRSILASLSQGERTINLPTGSTAHVIGDGGVTSKSDKLQVKSWKLEDESGQTFFIKQLKKQTKPQAFIAQKKLDLDLPVGPHGKFAGISLFARNLEESRRFYCELLGLPIKRDTETLVALGEHLVLRKNSFVRAVGEGSIVYVDVDNINQCWLNLRALNARDHLTENGPLTGAIFFACSEAAHCAGHSAADLEPIPLG